MRLEVVAKMAFSKVWMEDFVCVAFVVWIFDTSAETVKESVLCGVVETELWLVFDS